jgi:Transposase family tnp2
LLQFGNQSKTYAVCPSCNTLYNIADVIAAEESFKCTHVEFPMKPKKQSCGMELTVQIPLTSKNMIRPKLIFPLPNLKIQINSLYQRSEFKQQLREWTNRVVDNDMLADIYDGKIWKSFPDTSGVPYFTPETADSHLGIMINLDWFQPFESSVYSCGAIYGVICNLPRETRFKKENMLTLGLLPGPNEVRLHKINHYLSPIVDELIEFWNGIEIPAAGKNIRLALICCSNDIPAARKLCGHKSASSSCHRCYKIANVSGNKSNFGGFEDIDNWFVERDLEEHRRNAENWRLCESEEERRRHVRSTHVRWTELLRLPYFNPIRHLIVDPMHCLFLGIAHLIIKKLWIDGNKITKHDLEKMEKRAKTIQIPADLGRVPNKIATGEGFSGFTADQWKTFILIYAIPLMWDLLTEPDRKILGNFVRACSLLVCRIIDYNVLNEAHERLLKVSKLIEENYGPERITPNLHLCLHIADCCRDYGPLYSFWCFSFERMNGVLGRLLLCRLFNYLSLY